MVRAVNVVMLLLAPAAAVTPASKPNLVFALVDDLGWNGVGYHNPDLHTPVIDALAKGGVRLNSFYTYKVCSPARGSFLSGRFPYHLASIRDNFAYFDVIEGLNLTYTLFPEKLQGMGYATHMIGKWHQGFYAPQYLPTSRGFDTYFGFLSGCEDHDSQVVCYNGCNKTKYGVGGLTDLYGHPDGSAGPAIGKNGTNNGYLFTAAAVDLVNKHASSNVGLKASGGAEKPFFLYLALHNTHAPFEVPESYSSKYHHPQALQNVWSGMVSMVDETVNNITTAMKAVPGMWENTLWVMSGDNGSPVCGWGAAGSNAPLRGGKASNWEGGVKTFAFAAGGLLPASVGGTQLNGLFHICDLYKTFLSFAGNPTATDTGGPAPLDSVDLSDYLIGKVATSPRTIIVHDQWANGGTPTSATGAIRVGDMKLIVGAASQATWFGQFSPNATADPSGPGTTACATTPCLFNISSDPTEHNDLAALLPDLVTKIRATLNSYNNAFHSGASKGSDYDGYCTAASKSGGFMVPWRTEPAQDIWHAGEADASVHGDPLHGLDIDSDEWQTFVRGGYLKPTDQLVVLD